MNFVYIGFHGLQGEKLNIKKNKIFNSFRSVNDVDQKYFTDLIWFINKITLI